MSANKVLEIARGEVGYLEKDTNSQLDNKTANAGYNNYTKYGAWYGMNGQPWCEMFVSWCGYQAGESAAIGKYAYVPYHVSFFKNKGQWFNKGAKTPQPGDVIFFGDEEHVGLVEYVADGYVHTIEGNTRAGNTLVSNGGGVFQKSYPLTSSYIMGYGRPSYTGSDSSSSSSSGSKWGIDVSEWQDTINWTSVKNGGCSFAILRGGYRQATDACFHDNAKNAIAAGIPIGVYWFSYATTAAEAKAEASYCLSVIKNYKITLPVFFDWEYDSYNKAQAKGVTVNKTLFNDMAVAFCETILAAGYRTGVYYNLDYYGRFVDTTRLKKYYVWYAQYNSTADMSNYSIWQYSSSGSVSGISGNVDMNTLKDKYLLLTPGWQKNDTGWWYLNLDGTWPSNNWAQIKNEWYYFDKNGYAITNKTMVIDGDTYIFDNDGHPTKVTNEEEDEDMTKEKFAELMNEYLNDLASQEPQNWSKEHREWAENNGFIVGDEKGRKMYKKFLTREEFVTVLHRIVDKYGLGK